MLPILVGSTITLAMFLSGVIFKMGQHSARLESLETWRTNIRLDMHEISDKLEEISMQVARITVMLDRRKTDRD
jgi:hypothetical protein